MEVLIYEYEAVLREAARGKEFALGTFYKTKHISSNLRTMVVYAPLPPSQSLIEIVKDFTDIATICRLLRSGWIVVSKLTSEPGVEYLSGYITRDGNLLVGATQCRFVQSTTETWTAMRGKIETAMQGLRDEGIPYFQVIYTTVNKKCLKGSTYENAAVFTEEDMFELTRKLGPLRLHSEKLGAHMCANHPWLGRMSLP